MARKPTDTVQLKLRFSEALRRRLEREAKRHRLSLNTYIVDVLEREFRRSGRLEARAIAIAKALGEQIVAEIVSQAAADEDSERIADLEKEFYEERQRENK